MARQHNARQFAADQRRYERLPRIAAPVCIPTASEVGSWHVPDANGWDTRIPFMRPRYIQRAQAEFAEAWEKEKDKRGNDQFVFVGPTGLESHLERGEIRENDQEDVFGLRRLFREPIPDPYHLRKTNFQ